jgi:predicted nucleic acid-binding protein
VLIALIDPAHIWFMTTGAASWATCPMTENGVLRIVGDPKYPNSVGSPAACAPILAGLVGLPGHVFWADAISLRQDGLVDVAQIMTPGQVTDSYLLALAVFNGGKLATFDRRLSVKAVRGGRAGVCLIGGD